MEVLKLNSSAEIPKNYTGVVEFYNGTKAWYKEGNLHREDGPAVEHSDGTKEWWIEDKRHRIDGPAISMAGGSKLWYINNVYLSYRDLEHWLNTGIFLGKEKGKYNLYWLRFLTERGIKEFPIIPRMEQYKNFEILYTFLKQV